MKAGRRKRPEVGSLELGEENTFFLGTVSGKLTANRRIGAGQSVTAVGAGQTATFLAVTPALIGHR